MERRLSRGQAARPPLGRLVLRLARRHRGRQAARGARPHRPRRASAGARQRARRLPARSSEVFEGERFAELRAAGARSSARCGRRPASRTRPTRRRSTSTGWSGPTPSTRCRCRRCIAAARRGRRHRRDAPTEDPTADLDALREAGIDLDDVTDKLLRDGIDAFAGADGEAARRHRAQARGDRHRPARRRSRRTCRPSSSSRSPSASRSAADDDVVQRIWAADGTLWAPAGTPEIDRPPRLARRSPTKMLEDARRPRGVRRRGARRRATPTRVLLGMGGSSLAPEVFRRLRRRGRRADAARARLDRPGAGRARSLDAIDLDKTLFIVSSKSGGTIETMSQFEYFCDAPAATARTSSRSPTRARSLEARRASTASGACSRTTRTSAGATRRCRTSGSCPRRSSASTSRARARGAPRSARAELPAATEGNAGLWLGVVLGELAPHGRDKLTFVVDDAARLASACGSSSWSPSRPASRAGHPADRRRAARRPGRLRRRPRVRAHRATSDARRTPDARSRRCARPATR